MVKLVIDSTNLGRNGRIVIPKRVRDALDIARGDTLLFEKVSEDEVRIRVARGEDTFLRSIRNPAVGKAIRPDRLKEELWG